MSDPATPHESQPHENCPKSTYLQPMSHGTSLQINGDNNINEASVRSLKVYGPVNITISRAELAHEQPHHEALIGTRTQLQFPDLASVRTPTSPLDSESTYSPSVYNTAVTTPVTQENSPVSQLGGTAVQLVGRAEVISLTTRFVTVAVEKTPYLVMIDMDSVPASLIKLGLDSDSFDLFQNLMDDLQQHSLVTQKEEWEGDILIGFHRTLQRVFYDLYPITGGPEAEISAFNQAVDVLYQSIQVPTPPRNSSQHLHMLYSKYNRHIAMLEHIQGQGGSRYEASPSFNNIVAWRREMEHDLRERDAWRHRCQEDFINTYC